MGKYTKQWEARKPKKPVRPTSGFAKFISSYYSMLEGPKLTGPRLFRDASLAWKNLERAAQEHYVDAEALEAYKASLIEFKRTRAAMKAPPNSYALFVAHYWRTKKPNFKGTRQSFGIIQREIATEWGKMNEDEKGVHRAASNLLKALFEEEQSAVLNGSRALNVNWREAGLKKVYPMLLQGKQSSEKIEKESKMDEEQALERPCSNTIANADSNLDEFDEDFDKFD